MYLNVYKWLQASRSCKLQALSLKKLQAASLKELQASSRKPQASSLIKMFQVASLKKLIA